LADSGHPIRDTGGEEVTDVEELISAESLERIGFESSRASKCMDLASMTLESHSLDTLAIWLVL
jgi:hypothetical protein